jgi:tryptophan synthase alpha chain
MNRIDATFARLHASGRKALVGYLTAGDPSPQAGAAVLAAACRAGLDVLELGVPFSDPTSDGPAIQAASQRALRAGMTLRAALAMAAALRRDVETPLVFFSYLNPLLRYGLARFCEEAAGAGADGLLVVDLPPEEAGELRAAAAARNLHLIRLVAPTTRPERMRAIAEGAGGFLYLISRTGVTGEGGVDPSAVARHAAELRQACALPVCVGFGVRGGADAAALAPLADGVVVGSALVRLVAEHANDPRLPETVAAKVRELRQALDARR